MNATLVANLRATRALIALPQNWIQGVRAADSRGHEVNVGADLACKFCMLGAAQTAVPYTEPGPVMRFDGTAHGLVLTALALSLPRGRFSITEFNDDEDRTHPEVLAVFDTAITAAEAA